MGDTSVTLVTVYQTQYRSIGRKRIESMEYGILIVEDGNELYQILGAVWSLDEARELAENYERLADPSNPDTAVPPTQYVVIRRNPNGFYTRRESFAL